MDKLKQLETFASVATRGSLTAAAKAEGVAPAIIGRRLDALEARLGVKLMVRTTRRISLTHEGSAFLEDCQRLLTDLANAEASVSAGGVKASGHLRVTAPAGFGRRHVAPLVPRFRELHPEVSFSLNLSDRVVDVAGEGYDCAVRVGDLPDSSLVSVRLADNRRMCVAAPSYLQRHGRPSTPADLAHFDCLTLSSDASQTRGWAFRVNRGEAAMRLIHAVRELNAEHPAETPIEVIALHTTGEADAMFAREADEVLEGMGVSGQQEIRMIQAALARMDAGEYGVCTKCGIEIAPERLDVLPFTPFCSKCAA